MRIKTVGNYSAKKALAIPKRELARLGLEHPKITGIQMKLYKAFASTGATLTWDAMAKIETKVLVTAGLDESLPKGRSQI